jgi:hypothetical protein
MPHIRHVWPFMSRFHPALLHACHDMGQVDLLMEGSSYQGDVWPCSYCSQPLWWRSIRKRYTNSHGSTAPHSILSQTIFRPLLTVLRSKKARQ